MVEVRLRPSAQRDFVDIGDQTRDRWSEAQAERYLKQILEMIAEIGRHPFAGIDVPSIRSDYRRRRAGSHLIFYAILDDGTVEVVRILHERADVPRHLDE
ncbi:type II toxin-antitoxin system RelE/ParE family toxin [Affinirhizobium pseudoryzae]|uniref:type II toxin-antitoxin system RelE/ParE family toxin n=1 Tax=Allorhizobium pseudoryzae TaxID=379684 RepID=UPI0013EC8CC4|nr:type II toxin-antitoxin system RelE/ParE family toxin [Allorhizobium pseudoryzae]